MAAIPPVLLVLDISALSAATPREWLEFSRVGAGYVPQVIYEEMRFLFDRSPDPDLERVARAFNRFYATSGWQITDATASHALLKSSTGQALTKRARVSIAVARCAYGLSQGFPASLIVLVTNDRPLLQRLYEVQAANLCGVTGPALLQWSRTGQRPIAVSQKLQQMRVPSGSRPPTLPSSQQPTSPAHITTPAPAKPVKNPAIRDVSPLSGLFSQLISGLLSLAGLAIAGFILWTLINAVRSEQFRRPSNLLNQSSQGIHQEKL